MEMPCHCVIGDQYLPLQGGERKITCDHAEYVIKGEPVHGMKFSIVSITRTDEDDRDDPEDYRSPGSKGP